MDRARDPSLAIIASTLGPLVFNKYEVIRRLAVGGMGEIFLARQTGVGGFDRLVILKSLLPALAEDPKSVAEFLEEARIAAMINHPNIIAVYEVGQWENQHLIAMEYVDGDDLGRLVNAARRSDSKLPLPMCARIIHDAAVALGYAHGARAPDGRELNIVHRDVSPQNIMVRVDGMTKVLDFGIAKAGERSTRTAAGLVKGRVRYMAPEQLANNAADSRSDQYSLGVVFWELCTMSHLFEGDGTAAARMAAPVPKPPSSVNPEVPKILDEIIMRMLAKDREARFASCNDVASAIDVYLETCVFESSPREIELVVRQLVGDRVEERIRDLTPREDALLLTPSSLHSVSIRDVPPATVVVPPAPPKTRHILLPLALALFVFGIGVALYALQGGEQNEIAKATMLAQRGEYERAREVLLAYLPAHADDPEARMLAVLIEWWTSEVKKETVAAALAAPLSAPQRALVRGVELMGEGRRAEALTYLRGEHQRQPDSAEILYGLGEVSWHDGKLDEGAAALRRCFEVDPRWRLALHHVVEYHLVRNDAGALAKIIEKLRPLDPAAAAELEMRALINRHTYAEAIELGERASKSAPEDPKLLAALADAYALSGNYARGEEAAREAFEKWPIDDRESGGFARWSEYLLYRGRVNELMRLASAKKSQIYVLMQVLWRNEHVADFEPPTKSGARSLLLRKIIYTLNTLRAGGELGDYDNADEPWAPYREGILAAHAGDHARAIEAYRRGLKIPSGDDVNMLIAHSIAKSERALGDRDGAAEACSEVLEPRVYEPYRAVLLPDCLLWVGESSKGGPKYFHLLIDGWTGEFEHPSVLAARAHLAGP